MSLDYTDEKLVGAVYSLATGTGRIQDRLLDAWVGMHTISNTDFPDGDLANEWRRLHSEATAVPAAGSEGRFQATLLRLSDEDARSMAVRIVELSAKVRNLLSER